MPQPTRPQLLVGVALVLIALALAGRWLLRAGAEPTPRANAGTARQEADVVVRAPATAVLVHVAGAVRRPGVYRLRRGQRVQDAVRRAGGPSRRGDVDAINLAAPVQDGVQVVVPARQAAGTAVSAATGPAASAPSAPLSLATATAEQLDALDGVGPATAAKILEFRRQRGGFRSVDDLGQIPGIGPKRLTALRPKVRP